MREAFYPRGGAPLLKTTNWRQRAQRRRLAVAAAMAGLALVSAGLGALVSGPDGDEPRTGPFSYFPYQ